VHNLGAFVNPKSPRTFWCGVEAPGLAELAADTDEAAASLGIARETRLFRAHLTLARIKNPAHLGMLREAIMREGPLDFGSFEARTFFLYRSQLRRGGSVYTKLAEFPLTHS
jgi:2'-5' RNA ligase